jgi:glycosyl transferase family 25
MGGGGYILSNRAAIELLAFLGQCKELSPVDHVVFEDYPLETGKLIHQIVPALCIQDMHLAKGPTRFPSHLKDVRSVRRGENKEKERISVSRKLKREAKRILVQVERTLGELLQAFQGRRTVRIRFR